MTNDKQLTSLQRAFDQKALARLETFAKQATPGPWLCSENKDAEYAVLSGNIEQKPVGICYSSRKADMRFCAEANPDVVLALIDRIRKFDKEANWLAFQLGTYCKECKEDDPVRCMICKREWATKEMKQND